MTESRWSRRDRQHVRLPAHLPIICSFLDCDQDATDAVGTVALCALHRSLINQLLDEGVSVFDRTDAVQTD